VKAARPLVLLCLACGGYTPRSYCEANYQVSCEKTLECVPNNGVYTSVADCVQKQKMIFDCSTINESSICFGQGSGHFVGAVAGQCLSDIKALSCASLKSSGFLLPSTCQASSLCH
jgi:hypothetical protein